MDSAVLEKPATVLEIRADLADIQPASRWLAQQGDEHAIPPEQIFRLDLCLNEALANVIEHGGRAALMAPVRLALQVEADHTSGRATLRVSDAGLAFNPLPATPKALPVSLAEATPGGLGVVLMRSFADEVAYEHCDGRNCLQFAIQWSGP